MHFTLIDKILVLEPGVRIEAVKNVSLAEEYLQDHFPRFPVLPGVMMLEAMFQTAAWLVRAEEDFAHGMVILREARNVKYADFVEPGNSLRVIAEKLGEEGSRVKFKAHGKVGDRTAVQARLILDRYDVDDYSDAGQNEAVNDYIRLGLREQFSRLYTPTN